MRLWKKLLLSLATFLVSLLLVGLYLINAGKVPHRVDVIEKLSSPRVVKSWSTTGFLLEDGSVVTLPGIARLPDKSAFLDEIVRRGIEVDPKTARVVGLLPVDHGDRDDPVMWCGNETVGKHIARVDVSRFLEFVGEGAAGDGIRRSAWTRFGLRAGDYYEYLERSNAR